jgi:tRNA-dependent cyclodipeptide synthase
MNPEALNNNYWPVNTTLNYQLVEYSDPISATKFYQGESSNNELAKWIFLEVDGVTFQALVSCNYSLCTTLLKKRFSAKQVKISAAAYNAITINNAQTETIIDYNLALGSKNVVVKSDYDSTNFLIRIDELEKEANAKIINLETLPIYKAKVSFVSPISRRESYETVSYPFFGISLQNSNFIRPKLLASLEWICNRFKKCSVLIGDSIHRTTLQNNESLTEKEALDKALFLGKSFLQNELYIFEKFSSRCSFDFIFCSEIQAFPDYVQYYNLLQNLFSSNEVFRNSVISFAENYHVKHKDLVSLTKWEKLISNSCNYFLEEFAIFACLKIRGREAMIYPGSFSTLSEIAAGQHPEALEELKNLIVISLHIKKR